MLEEGKCYRDNNGKIIAIGGRIRERSEEAPYVYSRGGNWYNENTGAFVSYAKIKGTTNDYRFFDLDVNAGKSISNHNPIDQETLDGTTDN